mgnify:CR=1 FL=1
MGGIPGALPPVIGWTAATGSITLPALVLFGIVFLWQMPHFLAIAWICRDDYAAAGIPMLPVVLGEAETRRQIVLYSFLVVALTLIVFTVHLLGPVYLAGAVLLGALLIYYAVRLWRDESTDAARRMFKFSMLYLTLLFTAMVIDRQVIL